MVLNKEEYPSGKEDQLYKQSSKIYLSIMAPKFV